MSVKVLSIDDGGVASLACEGELDGLQMTGGEVQGLEALLGSGWEKRKVALDMSGATYMDSAAVGWLLSLHKTLKDGGGRLVVCGIRPTVKRVIELMRIQEVITIVDDHDAALKELSKRTRKKAQ